MKKWTLYMLLIICGVNARGQVDLDSLQQLAAKNNPELKMYFYQYKARLEQTDISTALPDPKVMFGYLIAPQNTNMMVHRFQASITQSFPWFGTLKAKGKMTRLQAKSAYSKFLNQKNELFAQVAIRYYNLYGLRQKILIYQRELKLLESIRQVAHSRYINGKTTLADVLSIDMRLAERQSKIEDLQAKQKPYRHKLEAVVDTLLPLIYFPDSLSFQHRRLISNGIEGKTLKDNHRLAALRWQVKAFQKQREVAKKSGLPHFSIGVSYMDMEMKSTHANGIMFPKIGISIPLNRKKYKAMKTKARVMAKATLSRQKAMHNELTTQLTVWQRKYQKAERKVKLYSKLYRMAQQTQQILVQSYSNGKSIFDEVLKMEKQVLGYALSKIQAQVKLKKYDYQLNSLIQK